MKSYKKIAGYTLSIIGLLIIALGMISLYLWIVNNNVLSPTLACIIISSIGIGALIIGTILSIKSFRRRTK